jgi:hypothetical protein
MTGLLIFLAGLQLSAAAVAPEYSLMLGTEWSREILSFSPKSKSAGVVQFSDGKRGKFSKDFPAKDYAEWLKQFKKLVTQGQRARGPCQAILYVTEKKNKPYGACFDTKPETERELTRAWRKLRGETVKKSGAKKK